MRVKIISGMFAGGYNSVYEQAWQDSLENFIYHYFDEYDIEISESELASRLRVLLELDLMLNTNLSVSTHIEKELELLENDAK